MSDERNETKDERRARRAAKKAEKERVAEVDTPGVQDEDVKVAPAETNEDTKEDTKEETKEERKARKRAAKEAKKAAKSVGEGEDGKEDSDKRDKKQDKKRKREEAESNTGAKPKSEQPKKKAALDTSAPIFSDESLSDQAKKAIHYVQQFGTPAWKFNKARQGWLLRHLWGDEIPDEHVGTVVAYLKTVMGGVRGALVAKAKEYVKEDEVKAGGVDEEVKAEQEAAEKQGVSKAGEDKEGKEDTKEEAEPADAEQRARRRERAGQLLEAMGEVYST